MLILLILSVKALSKFICIVFRLWLTIILCLINYTTNSHKRKICLMVMNKQNSNWTSSLNCFHDDRRKRIGMKSNIMANDMTESDGDIDCRYMMLLAILILHGSFSDWSCVSRYHDNEHSLFPTSIQITSWCFF